MDMFVMVAMSKVMVPDMADDRLSRQVLAGPDVRDHATDMDVIRIQAR